MAKIFSVHAGPAIFALCTVESPHRRRFIAGLLSIPLLKYLPGSAGLRLRSGWVLHQDDV